MADKFHAQRRHALGIPILLERENAQEQIVIARQLVRATRTRRPDLRRDELDDFRIPFGKRIFADVFFDGLTKAQIESAEINADDHVRFALNRQREQLVEQPLEFQNIFQHIGNANDRMLRHIKRQFHANGGHLRAARAEEDGRGWRIGEGGWQLPAQGGHKFRREQIAARLTGDEHESFWFHGFILTQRREDAEKFTKCVAFVSATEWHAIVAHSDSCGKASNKNPSPGRGERNFIPTKTFRRIQFHAV